MTKQLTMQEAYDKAARGIIAQGRQSLGQRPSFNACQYHGPNGTACAIGQLLPDVKTRIKWDERVGGIKGRSKTQWQDVYPLRVEAGLATLSQQFLGELQTAHDQAPSHPPDFIPGFKKSMRDLAQEYGLCDKVLDE